MNEGSLQLGAVVNLSLAPGGYLLNGASGRITGIAGQQPNAFVSTTSFTASLNAVVTVLPGAT